MADESAKGQRRKVGRLHRLGFKDPPAAPYVVDSERRRSVCGDFRRRGRDVYQCSALEMKTRPNQALLRNAGRSVRFPSDVRFPAW